MARYWYCPNCEAEARTVDGRLPVHTCASLRGLSVSLVACGVRAKVEALERDDYVGRELVQIDGAGRPIMSVVTTRDDGQDCTVYAPTARVTVE